LSLLDRIRECNAWNPAAFRPFRVAGHAVGRIKAPFAEALAGAGDVFEVSDEAVALDPALASPAARTAAVEGVLRALADGARPGGAVIEGWRDEPYPVALRWGAPPLLTMERAAIPYFGVRAYGVHMNGFVAGPGGLALWVARRASDKPTYPGMLDNMVAGGQPVGISLRDNLVKECAEEAGIPPEIAARAVPVGAIGYCHETEEGLKPDVQFVYDLELPADFEPANADGEVEGFELWPMAQALETVAETREFKFNCALVVIDFAVRHGAITPDEPDYLEIVQGLRG